MSTRTRGCPTAFHGFLTANVRSPTIRFQKVNVPPSRSLPSSCTLLSFFRYVQRHSAFLAAAPSQHPGLCDRVALDTANVAPASAQTPSCPIVCVSCGSFSPYVLIFTSSGVSLRYMNACQCKHIHIFKRIMQGTMGMGFSWPL